MKFLLAMAGSLALPAAVFGQRTRGGNVNKIRDVGAPLISDVLKGAKKASEIEPVPSSDAPAPKHKCRKLQSDGWATIFDENFETTTNDLGVFGSTGIRNTDPNFAIDSVSAKLENNGGTAATISAGPFDVSAYGRVQFSFSLKPADGLTTPKSFIVEFSSDDTTWKKAGEFTVGPAGSNFAAGSWHDQCLQWLVNGSSPNMSVRITALGNDNVPVVFFDDLTFFGKTIAPTSSCSEDSSTPAWVMWHTESFEDGPSFVWDVSQANAQRVGSTNFAQGTFSVRVRDDEDSSMVSIPIAVDVYDKAELNFWFLPNQMEAGKGWFVEKELDGSGTWDVVDSLVSGVDFVDALTWTQHCLQFDIPTTASLLKFRIRGNGPDQSDQLFLDDLRIRYRATYACSVDDSGWNQLLFEDFEEVGGLGDMTATCSGGQCGVNKVPAGPNQHARDAYAVRLRNKKGDESSLFTRPLDVAGYQTASFNFEYKLWSMEDGKDFFVSWQADGTGPWMTLNNVVALNGGFASGSWYTSCTQWAIPTGTQSIIVKIEASGDLDSDQIFVDNISFKAEASVDQATDSCSATDTSSWGIILAEDFQTPAVNGGLGEFNSPGNDAMRIGKADGSLSVSGAHSVRIRDNEGDLSALASNAFDVSAYSALQINFKFKAISMEDKDDFFVEIEYDGTGGWNDITQLVSGTDFTNGDATTGTLFSDYCILWKLPDSVNSAKIRFRADGDGDDDQVYIDDIVVKGGSFMFS